MMKQLKDYLHLYIGCQCLRTNPEHIFELDATSYRYYNGGSLTEIDDFELKPILRPLSSMTEEEKLHIAYNFAYPHIKFSNKQSALDNMEGRYKRMFTGYTDEFHYLLSKHFDIFNLIPEGLAIDATTLKPA